MKIWEWAANQAALSAEKLQQAMGVLGGCSAEGQPRQGLRPEGSWSSKDCEEGCVGERGDTSPTSSLWVLVRNGDPRGEQRGRLTLKFTSLNAGLSTEWRQRGWEEEETRTRPLKHPALIGVI